MEPHALPPHTTVKWQREEKKWPSASEVLRPALLGQVPQGSENVTATTVEPSCSQKNLPLCSWRWISGGIHSSPSGSLKQLKHQIYLGVF